MNRDRRAREGSTTAAVGFRGRQVPVGNTASGPVTRNYGLDVRPDNRGRPRADELLAVGIS